MNTWIVKDNELGKLVRFRHPSARWPIALKSYLQFINPELSQSPAALKSAIDNFNGEIYDAEDIEDIWVG